MTAPFGVLTSPNYPNMYDSHDDCPWLIEVDPNHVVVLQYEDFDVEPHSNCSYDYVALYDGANASAPLLALHCGAGVPQPNMFKTLNLRFCVNHREERKTENTALWEKIRFSRVPT